MTNEELVIAIRAGAGTAENMAQLWEQTKGFIHSVAWRYRHYAELDDLEQEGYLALYDAVDGYDPAAGYLFLTYARHWIRQRITRCIQNGGTVRLPVWLHELMRKYDRLEVDFLTQRGRKPTEGEISRYLGLTPEQTAQLLQAVRMKQTGSLDGYVGEDMDMPLAELVAGPDDVEGDVLDAVEQEDLRATLWRMVDRLPDRQPDVLHARYQEGLTYKEIGARLGVNGKRARSMEWDAIRILQQQGHRLRAFLPDDVESIAYGGSVEGFNRTWTSSTERAAMRL